MLATDRVQRAHAVVSIPMTITYGVLAMCLRHYHACTSSKLNWNECHHNLVALARFFNVGICFTSALPEARQGVVKTDLVCRELLLPCVEMLSRKAKI